MTPPLTPTPSTADQDVVAVASSSRSQRRQAARNELASERSVISVQDRKNPVVRATVNVIGGLLLISLIVVSIGPLLWLFKAATSTSTDTLADPFGLWPSGFQWENFSEAFRRVRFGTYLANTGWIVAGNWFFGMLVATTAGYVLAVLRPRYTKVLSAAIMATLFVPGVISLIALYLTIVRIPGTGISLINTFWAVWLPAGASAFNVLIVQRAFEALPSDIFDAAKIDGAGSIRVFFTMVLPMSKPILGVVSLLTMVNAYKDFLWPLLVLPDNNLQPLSVALPRLEAATELSVYMAALFLALVIPIILFLVFQKQFLRAAGSSGAIKG